MTNASSHTFRHFILLISGELVSVGTQTLLNIVRSQKACKYAVGDRLHVIEIICANEGRTLKSVTLIKSYRYKMLPTGYVDENDVLANIRHLQNAASSNRQNHNTGVQDESANAWSWTPTEDQLNSCYAKLGLSR